MTPLRPSHPGSSGAVLSAWRGAHRRAGARPATTQTDALHGACNEFVNMWLDSNIAHYSNGTAAVLLLAALSAFLFAWLYLSTLRLTGFSLPVCTAPT